jgi:hypothetical protein
LLGLVTAAPPASAWDRGDVDVLTVLPDATPGNPSSVEGLTVGPDGNVYAATFGFNATGALSGNAVLYVIKPDGRLLRQRVARPRHGLNPTVRRQRRRVQQ